MKGSCKRHLVEPCELLARSHDLVQVRLVELLRRIGVELRVGLLDGLPVEVLDERLVELVLWIDVDLLMEVLGELPVELLSAFPVEFQVEFPGWNSRQVELWVSSRQVELPDRSSRQVELPGWSLAHSFRPTSSGQARWNSRWSANSALDGRRHQDLELPSPAVGRQCKISARPEVTS